MMAYKLGRYGGVIRLSDNAFIPDEDNNQDWRVYQDWLAAGNTPQPADPAPVPIDLSNLDNLDNVLKSIGLLMRQYTNALQAGTHTQKTVTQLKSDFAAIYNALP